MIIPYAVFDLVQECIDQCLKREATNFRQVLEMEFKLIITLRHLATRESYKSLGCHWRVGGASICKFVPDVFRAILHEFQEEYLICPKTPAKLRQIEKCFTINGMSPML